MKRFALFILTKLLTFFAVTFWVTLSFPGFTNKLTTVHALTFKHLGNYYGCLILSFLCFNKIAISLNVIATNLGVILVIFSLILVLQKSFVTYYFGVRFSYFSLLTLILIISLHFCCNFVTLTMTIYHLTINYLIFLCYV